MIVGTKDGDEKQQRHDGEVLQQQDRKGRAPRHGVEPLPARQHLDHDGGGGQRQGKPDEDGAAGPRTEQARNEPDQEGRDRHLQEAETEHQAAHGDKALERELETDEEQQEHDAQLGDGAEPPLVGDGNPSDRGKAVPERAEPPGAQQRAGDEEAEDGAKFEALAQGHENGRRPEHDHRVAINAEIGAFRHSHLVLGASPPIIAKD